ncbi:MAG: hypothetical protein ACTHM7_04990 [Ginsengibacter sp.]
MEITITSQSKSSYLLIETKAHIDTKEDLMEQSKLLYDEFEKYPFKKILIDERQTHLPDDIYAFFDLVKGYVEDFTATIRDYKVAVVVAPQYKEMANTWETLCISRKLNNCALH